MTFFNEQEVHSAGSDARQQSLIFKEMMGLRDRLSSEQLTEQDIKRPSRCRIRDRD